MIKELTKQGHERAVSQWIDVTGNWRQATTWGRRGVIKHGQLALAFGNIAQFY